MQSVMWRQSDTIKPNQIQLRSGLPVSSASCSISSMSSKSETLVVTLFIAQLNTVTGRSLSNFRALRHRRCSARSFNESVRRLPNLIGHPRFGRNEFRSEPREQANQIVRYQNLPIALFARTDPDRRDTNRVCNLFRDLRDNNLEHN